MTRSKLLFAALLLVASLAVVPAATAGPTVHFAAVGSSAMYQASGVAVFNDLATPIGNAHHYTVKTSTACSGGTPCAYIHELRGTPGQIPDEAGTLWVVWAGNDGSGNATDVWAYLQVDTIVGNRAFFANPRPLFELNPDTNNGAVPGVNNIDKNLFVGTQADDTKIPNAVFAAITSNSFTAALSDVRPEDALFEHKRIVATLSTSNYNGLGYVYTNNVGIPIKSSFTNTQATPVAFALKGKDPISGNKVGKWKAIQVGAEPIIFIINRTNPNGFGQAGHFTNATHQALLNVFDGDHCNGAQLDPTALDFPVIANLREPLSGTMTTTEFTTFRIYTSTKKPKTSQEKNVGVPTVGTPANPLSATGVILDSGKPCAAGGGVRKRGIGTGEIVNTAVFAPVGCPGTLSLCDSIGYTFFSYGNISKLEGNANFGYLQEDGVDPLFTSYTDGKLPACASPTFCPALPGTSFPHIRDGSYQSWSILRAVGDPTASNFTDLQNIVSTVQNEINTKVPDLVPAVPISDGDPGLTVYRSHYTQASYTPDNLIATESGGDVGGCIFNGPPDDATNHLNKHQGGAIGGSCWP